MAYMEEKTYSALRDAYPDFYYESFEITPLDASVKLTFRFSIKNLASFSPAWVFPVYENAPDYSSPAFKNMVFNLGLAELVSYWKITCSPRVHILAGALYQKQVSWWKKLYYNGLGEFFYLNNISPSPESFMDILSEGEPFLISKSARPLSGNLIPVGGGKDSAVTLEILSGFKDSNHPYIINPRGATTDTVSAAGLSDKAVCVTRTLDSEMLRLNSEGFLNGHTPFSSVVAFSSIIAAYIASLKYVVLSNESSANESTVAGSSVNHQYSKSFEFERDFHLYEEEFIKSGVYYFSLLRPLSEYQIAKYFSRLKKYHPIFRSCNRGSKENIWCGKCPKCLFVWLILSPFLTRGELCGIFGRDLSDDETLIPTLEKLTGIAPEKPFECVGSRSEVNFALTQAVKNSPNLPKLYLHYSKTQNYLSHLNAQNPYDSYFDENHLIPAKFLSHLERECFGDNS